jgi:hypothetical protein
MATPYHKEEKARFLFLEVPADVAGGAGAVAAAPLATSTARAGSAVHTGASVAHAGTSATRAASAVDRLVASALRPPRTMVLLPPESAPVTGVQAPTCRGETAPYLLPLLPPPLPRLTTSTLLSRARRAPAAHAAGTPRSSAPGAPATARSALSCASPAPALTVAPCVRAHKTGAWAGRTARRSHAPSARIGRSLKTRQRHQ